MYSIVCIVSISETKLELANAVCCMLTHLPSLTHFFTFAITPYCTRTTSHLLHKHNIPGRRVEMMLQGLPYDATTAMALVYGGLLALMGVLISWAAPACNNPIFAEIVPPHLRNMIYSFDRSDVHSTSLPSWLCVLSWLACLATQSCASCAAIL